MAVKHQPVSRRLGNSSLLSPYEAFRLSLASPRASLNAIIDRFRGIGELTFPRRVVLHLANRCNFACPMCSVGIAREERGKEFKGDALFEVVEKTIAECAKHGTYVELTGGEPTLYKHLAKTISLLNRYRLPSYITTNGLNLYKTGPEMVRSGLKVLMVSVDGWDEASSYERGLVPGSFDAIRKGLSAVIDARKGIFPIIRVLSVVTKVNCHSMERIGEAIYDMGVRRWIIQNYAFMTDAAMAAHNRMKAETGLGDQVMAHHVSNVDSYLTQDEVCEFKQSLSRIRSMCDARLKGMRIDFDWKLDLDSYYSPKRPALSSSCSLPFNRVDIYPDGRIATCGDAHTMGNVLTGSIAEAWNGKERQRMLDLLARERILPMCFRCCGILNGLRFDETSTPYSSHDFVQLTAVN